jgi:hypothetical protein
MDKIVLLALATLLELIFVLMENKELEPVLVM